MSPGPLVLNVITKPEGGGAELIVRELTGRLRAAGIDCQAIYFSNPTNVRLKHYEHCFNLSSPKSPLAVIRLREFLNEHSKKRPTIVHAHLTWGLYYTYLALKGFHHSAVYTEHHSFNRRRDFPMLRYLERAVYRRYETVVCISESVQKSLKQWLGASAKDKRRFPVVWNGARLFEFKETRNTDPDKLRLVSVGSLSEQKGFEYAISAVAKLREQVEQYVIVGEGYKRVELESLIAREGLSDIIKLVGWQADIATYFHRADICLIPSVWEGFGLVAIEALSTGLPVVASDVDGLREILKGCPAAIPVSIRDPESLRIGIENAVSRLRQDRNLAVHARNHAERFTLEAMTGEYLSIYKKLLRLDMGSLWE